MAVKVYIDGAVCDPDNAFVSVFDRGFLYGDSVYEVMRTSGGRPVDYEPHIDRLYRSANLLGLRVPERAEIAHAVRATLADADNQDSYIRIVVTRGSGEIGLDTALADDPTLIVIVKPLRILPESAYRDGIALRIVGVQRTAKRAVDPAVKSGNYLNNIMALREAREYGADEALMCDSQGRVAEGSTSNLFVVQAGAITTPGLDVDLLQGITRARVVSLAESAGITVREGRLLPAQVRSADEVFITSSIRSVVPVKRVDDIQLAYVPGPVTTRIMALYSDYLAAVAADS